MRAQNLTISVPYKGCDKNCPYCVSRMTGYMESDYLLMKKKFNKVKNIAKAANVTSVLFTGKGEPFLNRDFLLNTCREFNEWPIEVQTNGIWLNNNQDFILKLSLVGIDILAISIDSFEQFESYKEMLMKLKENGIIVRICMNITKLLPPSVSFGSLFNELSKDELVDQILIRRITIPTGTKLTDKGAIWIINNVDGLYDRICHQFITDFTFKKNEIRVHPDGMKVWDVRGVAVSFSDYCIQDKNNSDDIRSLIFQEDGHLYTSWNSKASILF